MKSLLLFLLLLPGLLLAQVDQSMDTIDFKQTELKNDLIYKTGAEAPFTGIVIKSIGEGVDGQFFGSVLTYTKGQLVKYEDWDFLDGHQFKETHVLQGARWVSTGTANYDVNGNLLRNNDYEKKVETYYYDNGNKKEEIGSGDKNYHKFWDRDGNEIHPETIKAKNTAPLHTTLQVHISKYAFIGYFLILITTISIIIFKLRNVEEPPQIKIATIMGLSVIALIVSLSIYNYITNNLSYERGGIWATAFGSLYSVLYLIPYIIQIIALSIAVIGISRKPKKTW